MRGGSGVLVAAQCPVCTRPCAGVGVADLLRVLALLQRPLRLLLLLLLLLLVLLLVLL